MPYEKVKGDTRCRSDQIAVVKTSDRELMGCHDSEQSANAQLAALNAAEVAAENSVNLPSPREDR